MTKYSLNPGLNFATVKTVNGKTEYKSNCRKIRDKYYIIDEDCFLVEGKYYAVTSKLITYDYEKEKYVLLTTPLVYGIVKFKKDGTPVFGYFTENKYNNVLISVPNYGSVKTFNTKILDNTYAESISDGVWYCKASLSDLAIRRLGKIESRRVYKEKGYNIEDNADEFAAKVKAYNEYPTKIPAAAARYAKLLGKTTYGFEVETSMGYIPEHIQNRTGVIICRDGSIDNAEYVTIPMQGAKGLMNIKYLSTELKERTITDIKCSFHIHLGTIPFDRMYIVALYALGVRIQDEIFTMFPHYKTEWQNFKKKNYNQKLRKIGIGLLKSSTKEEFNNYIDDAYCRIFKFLNEGLDPDDNFNRVTLNHRRSAKWDRVGRYYWLNFMNFFFSNRKTAEFRVHHGTLNHYKMTNWLFICNAIARYAETHAKDILSSNKPIALDEILNYYTESFKTPEAKFLAEYLKAYVKDRKEYFKKDFLAGDFASKKELQDDKDYVFTYNGVSNLF